MRAYGVEGLSVAVIDGGRIAWAKGYGFAHAGTRRPVTPETLFQAASISKPVTTVGALLLVEHGKVGLDADVNRYLREWKISANALTATHPVTLRTLLDHSSGITDYAGPNYKPGESVPTLLQTLRAHAAEIRVASVPGKEYRYWGMGFVRRAAGAHGRGHGETTRHLHAVGGARSARNDSQHVRGAAVPSMAALRGNRVLRRGRAAPRATIGWVPSSRSRGCGQRRPISPDSLLRCRRRTQEDAADC